MQIVFEIIFLYKVIEMRAQKIFLEEKIKPKLIAEETWKSNTLAMKLKKNCNMPSMLYAIQCNHILTSYFS